MRIGAFVLDAAGPVGPLREQLAAPDLSALLAAGSAARAESRQWLQSILTDGSRRPELEPHLHPVDQVTLALPFQDADYVDFYASLDHASNIRQIFRPDSAPLRPNWRHLPVGYHGRAGTVAVSGTPVRRPRGQRRPDDSTRAPGFGPSTQLDIETELGFAVGTTT